MWKHVVEYLFVCNRLRTTIRTVYGESPEINCIADGSIKSISFVTGCSHQRWLIIPVSKYSSNDLKLTYCTIRKITFSGGFQNHLLRRQLTPNWFSGFMVMKLIRYFHQSNVHIHITYNNSLCSRYTLVRNSLLYSFLRVLGADDKHFHAHYYIDLVGRKWLHLTLQLESVTPTSLKTCVQTSEEQEFFQVDFGNMQICLQWIFLNWSKS
jgi:hypothetical protein